MNPTTDIKAPGETAESLVPSGKAKGGVVLERPAQEAGTWQRWHLPPEGDPELLGKATPLATRMHRVIALPSSSLFSWPLWIAAEGDVGALVRMELSGRHLLKRGMEDSLVMIPVLKHEGRRLILAVAPDEPFPEQGMPANWKEATRFEFPARIHGGAEGSDLILWLEWGTIQAAFYREGKVVWFSGLREQGLTGLLRRVSLRLLAEGVLEHPPATVRIEGMPAELTAAYAEELGQAFPGADIHRVLVPPAPWWGGERRVPRPRRRSSPPDPPHLPEEPFDIPPSGARLQRASHGRREKLFSLAIVMAFLYLLLLIWGAGDLLIRRNALKKIRAEIAGIEAAAQEANNQSQKWRGLRSAIDPTTYALDLLAAVATPTEGGKVRLTRVSLEQGRLQLSGEATDVTQAYGFIEQLKKNPLLRDYDWNAGQPQLAGKNSVRFDMEGTKSDAATGTK